ncbi:hypothetical protein OKHIF_23380 [Mycobacteroides chelonae]
MARILIAAIGSYGDVAPLTGIGVRLRQAGHQVTIAAFDRFSSLITASGLHFRGVAEPDTGPGRRRQRH